ncbi:zinc finger protein 622-like [Pelomyxa schiedti]|nr:zinc finger protein 622-like [Pelomyxa schiedti]
MSSHGGRVAQQRAASGDEAPGPQEIEIGEIISVAPPTNVARLTCVTCRVFFTNIAEHRSHFSSSDWHRYNLKRKAEALPPVPEAEFNEKMNVMQAHVAHVEKAHTVYTCHVCGKTFRQPSRLDSHMEATGHMPEEDLDATDETEENEEAEDTEETESSNTATTEIPDETERIFTDRELQNRIPPRQCLFCNNLSTSIDRNLEHMMRAHNFFIPFLEYVVDLTGLLDYLGIKIGVAHCCITCPARKEAFSSVRGVQSHMLSLCHCRFEYEGNEDEYSSFYDFTKSYEGIPGGDEDMPESAAFIGPTGYELLFTDGKVAGHRALALYYRQNAQPPAPDSVVVSRQEVEARMSRKPRKNKKVAKRLTQAAQSHHELHEKNARLGVQQNKLLILGARR